MLPEVKADLIADIVRTLVAVITSGIGTLLLTWLLNRNKSEAETEKLQAEAQDIVRQGYAGLLDQLQEQYGGALGQIEKLNRDVKKLMEQIDFLLGEVEKLQNENEQLQTTAKQQLSMIEGLLKTVGDLRAEVDRWKGRFERLFEWIRAQGLEPPTMEELERE